MADENTTGQFEDGSEEQAENRMEDSSGAPDGREVTEDPESGQFVAGSGESGIYGGSRDADSQVPGEAGGDVSTGGYGGSEASGGSQATAFDSGLQAGAGGEAGTGAFAGAQGADDEQTSAFDSEGQSGFRNDADAGSEPLGATDQSPIAGDTGSGGFDAGREAERTESGETGDRQRPDEEGTEDGFERGVD